MRTITSLAETLREANETFVEMADLEQQVVGLSTDVLLITNKCERLKACLEEAIPFLPQNAQDLIVRIESTIKNISGAGTDPAYQWRRNLHPPWRRTKRLTLLV